MRLNIYWTNPDAAQGIVISGPVFEGHISNCTFAETYPKWYQIRKWIRGFRLHLSLGS